LENLLYVEASKGLSLINLSADSILQMKNWLRNVLFVSVVVMVIASQTFVADDKLTSV